MVTTAITTLRLSGLSCSMSNSKMREARRKIRSGFVRDVDDHYLKMVMGEVDRGSTVLNVIFSEGENGTRNGIVRC